MDIICDIDGTVANIEHRRKYVATKPKNWPAFNKGMKHDTPIAPVVHVIRSLWRDPGNRIIFCSGRTDDTRELTASWLRTHVITPTYLYMRKTGDYRDDGIVKFELLQQIRADGFNPVMAFDDRLRVCKMWVENGIHLFDVSQLKGDF